MKTQQTKTHFYHIPKTAGRSIIVSFLRRIHTESHLTDKFMYKDLVNRSGKYKNDNMCMSGWNPKSYGQHFFTFGHHTYHAEHCKNARKHLTHSITSIRKPFDRLFSLYKEHLFERKNGRAISTTIKNVPDTMFDDMTFGNFVKRLPKKRLLEQLYYFSDSYNINEAIENVSKLTHVFFVDDILNDRDSYAGKTKTYLCISNAFRREIDYKISKKERSFINKLIKDEIKFYTNLKKIYKSIYHINTPQNQELISTKTETETETKIIPQMPTQCTTKEVQLTPKAWTDKALTQLTILHGIDKIKDIRVKVRCETNIIDYGVPPLIVRAPFGSTIVISFDVIKKHKWTILNRPGWTYVKRGLKYECFMEHVVKGGDYIIK